MVNRGAPKPEVFCVVVSPTSVRIERRQSASEYPIETIASFEGAPRLVLIRKDGRRETLAPVFPDDADTIALAARLDELVAAARRWSGGYR